MVDEPAVDGNRLALITRFRAFDEDLAVAEAGHQRLARGGGLLIDPEKRPRPVVLLRDPLLRQRDVPVVRRERGRFQLACREHGRRQREGEGSEANFELRTSHFELLLELLLMSILARLRS